MKKRFWITALSACVLLTGCSLSDLSFNNFSMDSLMFWKKGEEKQDEKEEEKKEEEKQEEEEQEPVGPVLPEGSMTISDLPENLWAGDVLDLEDYVTLFLIPDFTVELAEKSADIAMVEGHKLTVTGEGDLEFTVKAGKFSETFQYDTMRAIRKEMLSYFEGVGNNYTVDVYAPQFDDDDNYIGMSWEDTIYHSTNYILTLTTFDSDEQGNPIPGGFLRFGEEDDDCYMFEVLGEDTPEISLTGTYSPVLLKYYNADFSVDFSKAKYEYDAQYDEEYLVIEGEEAMVFAENTMFIPNGALTGGGNTYPFDRIEFMYENIADENEEPFYAVTCNTYVLYQGHHEFWNTGVLYTAEEYVGLDFLDEYCVPENEPVGKDYFNEFFAEDNLTFADFILGPDAKVAGQNGMILVSYGWVDDDGNEIEQPADSMFGYSLPNGAFQMFTSENSVWQVEYDDENAPLPIYGRAKLGDQVYNVFATEDGYYTEEDFDSQSAWDLGSVVFAGLRDPENWKPGCISSVTFDEEMMAYVFEFNGGKFNGLLEAVIDGVSGLGGLGDAMDYYYSRTGDNLGQFFDGMFVIQTTTGMAQLAFSFTWDDGQIFEVSFTSLPMDEVTSYTNAYEEMISALL